MLFDNGTINRPRIPIWLNLFISSLPSDKRGIIGTAAAIAMGVVGVAGVVGSVLSSKSQTKAAKEAARATMTAEERALDLQREMWEKSLELRQPFYDVGLAALPELEKAIRGGYDFTASPVAKYAMETGGREYMRGLGARGLAGGGIAPYGLADLKSRIYASDYDKQIARLSGLVDIGTGTASGLSNLGQQYATNAGNITINAGENQANAILAQGRNQASLYSGMGQIPMNLASLYLMSGGGFGGGGGITKNPFTGSYSS